MKTLRFIRDLCIGAACLLLISPFIVLGLIGLLLAPSKPKVKSNQFRYAYQRHPFDDPQYFTVTADDQDAADVQARTHFQQLFDNRATVMTHFYRA